MGALNSLFSAASAQKAGYARDLPVPVPASIKAKPPF